MASSKTFLSPFLCEGRTFNVLDGAKLLGQPFTILSRDGSQPLPGKLVNNCGVITEINLRTDNEARHARAVMMDLRQPFLLDVFK